MYGTLRHMQGFYHTCGICPRSNKEEKQFLVYTESSKSYACCAKIKKLGYSGTFVYKRDTIKQLQSQLAEMTGTSVKLELLENPTKFQ